MWLIWTFLILILILILNLLMDKIWQLVVNHAFDNLISLLEHFFANLTVIAVDLLIWVHIRGHNHVRLRHSKIERLSADRGLEEQLSRESMDKAGIISVRVGLLAASRIISRRQLCAILVWKLGCHSSGGQKHKGDSFHHFFFVTVFNC